jgi:hypothetical protein
MTRPFVEWHHVRRIWLEILRREAPYFVGALAIASVVAAIFGLRYVWLGAALGLPLAILGPARVLSRALAREYHGFRIVVIELQGKRETMVSATSKRRAREYAELLGLPLEREPDPTSDFPKAEVPLDRERSRRVYWVSQFWEAVLALGAAFVLRLPMVLVDRLVSGLPSTLWNAVSLAIWLAVFSAASFWALRRALEHTYPDFHLEVVATEAVSERPDAAPPLQHLEPGASR